MNMRVTTTILLALMLAPGACGGSTTGTSDTDDTGTPASCDVDRELMDVQEILADDSDPCHAWVATLYGRAVLVTDIAYGSASLWSRRTEHGTGLMTTAAHVLTPCFQGSDCPARLHDPKQTPGQSGIRLTAANGNYIDHWSAHFPLYNPQTPAELVESPAILPRYDFTVYAVDSQTFDVWALGDERVPQPIVDAPLTIEDPRSLTLADPTWTDAAPGDDVLVLGYPVEVGIQPQPMLASVGRVLDDDEAERAIATLDAAGDEEGTIAYDPEAEWLVEGHAVAGMSGSGVFDRDGLQVGVLVRGSFADIGVQYLRVVRMRYIVEHIEAALTSLTEAQRAAIAPYLEQPT